MFSLVHLVQNLICEIEQSMCLIFSRLGLRGGLDVFFEGNREKMSKPRKRPECVSDNSVFIF